MATSGPEALKAFERRIASDKAAKIRGTARVRIAHLKFPSPIRSKDDKIIEQLKRTFAAEGCLDEQHRIPAIIDDDTLQAALNKTGINIESLQFISGQPVNLQFPDITELECLHGNHRVLAARRYLPPAERWWTVDFYRTDLEDNTRQNLREGHAYSSNYSDGEIFRQLRCCQVAGDSLGEGRWRARLTPTKDRDLKQLLKRGTLLGALDSILPIKGLWKDFHLGSLDIFLTLRCDEDIAHYIINAIKQAFSTILGGEIDLMGRTDEATVEAIQLRAPGVSRYDFEFIQQQMASGIMFPQIRELSKREEITSRLLSINHPIRSIYSLFKDLRFLRPGVIAIRRLVPRSSKKTLREMLHFHFENVGCSHFTLQIQNGERSYSAYTGNSQSLSSLASRQLILYTIRHFAKPARQREDQYSMFGLAELARTLGFASKEIDSLLNNDPYQKMALDLLQRTLPTQKPADCYDKAQVLAKTLRELINSLSSAAVEESKPWLTVPGLGVPISQRCGPEVWDNNTDSDDLKHIFLHQMHLDPSDLQRGGEGISSFYVKRSIYLAFFGSLVQSGESSPPFNTTQVAQHLRVHEQMQSASTTSADQEEPGEQMNVVPPDHDIPEESTYEAEIQSNPPAAIYRRRQVVMFSEDGVTIHETPFLKDPVNEQARKIAETGKSLSTLQGQYFLWEDCFDMLSRTETAVVRVSSVNSRSDGFALVVAQGKTKRRRVQGGGEL